MTAEDDLLTRLGPQLYASWKWFIGATPTPHHERHAEVLLDVLAKRPVRVTEQELAAGITFPDQVIVPREQVAPFIGEGMHVEPLDTDEETRKADRDLISRILSGARKRDAALEGAE